MTIETPLPPPMHPQLLHLHDVLTKFRESLEIGATAGQATEKLLVRGDLAARVDSWLYELKLLAVVAYRYEQDNAFFHRLTFHTSTSAPLDASSEHKFKFENSLVMSALILDSHSFHLFTSILLDRVARFFGHYYLPSVMQAFRSHDKLWNELKDDDKYPFITAEVRKEARWLKDRVDPFRNRVITHPEEFDKQRSRPGIVSPPGENVARAFVRSNPASGKETAETEAEAVPDIFKHLARYLHELVTIFGRTRERSVLA